LFFKEKARNILSNRATDITISLLTIYALFAENFKNLFTNKDSDNVFSIICILIIIIFMTEFIFSCLSLDNYLYGFYFFMDIISIISMLLDIDWFYNYLINGTSTGTPINKNIKSISAVVRAGKAAKIGSRAIKILRIIRILRQIRIIKLYKESEKVFNKHFNKKLDSKNNKNPNMPNESIVGRKLSELTSRRLIILVFVVVMGIFFLDVSFYFEKENTMDYGIRIFKYYNKSDPYLEYVFELYVKEHLDSNPNLIFAQIGDISYGDFNKTINIRDDAKIISIDDCPGLSDYEDYQTVIVFFFKLNSILIFNNLNLIVYCNI